MSLDFKDRELAKCFASQIAPLIDRPQLAKLREAAKRFREESDWPWCGFIVSFATNGGSANWSKNVEPRKGAYQWENLVSLPDLDRLSLFTRLPNPIRRSRLGPLLEQAFQRFKRSGGPQAVRQEYEALRTADERVKYLEGFPGIGPKYARNIPMDAYDRVVSNHFAIDSRLKKILKEYFGAPLSYRESEAFLNEVSRILGLDAWSLDRFLYNNERPVRAALSVGAQEISRQVRN